ncbi:TIGR04255 family protein [Paraburkholderia sp. RL16-012-BIC-B]|nr:TIGR04255 family protein [Paraburkholderia madseniana]
MEVVAELQWNLTPVSGPLGAAVDPFFDILRADLTPRLAALGYGHVMDLVPPQLPREIMAWKPLCRYAASENAWPKLQLGPGLFSVNMSGVQYTGWPNFRRTIEDGVGALIASFPSPERLLHFKSVQLRYIDAFTQAHNYRSNAQFALDYLGLDNVLPDRFIDKLRLDPAQITTASNTRFTLPALESSSANIVVSDAKVNGSDSCLVQFNIETAKAFQPRVGSVMEWLESAHVVAKDMFLSLASDELQNIMLPEEKK